ncbi:DUF3105 domain-containing protein [Microbacterium sp. NPDC091313]
MTDKSRRTSGNPATQAQLNQTVKQQREQKRQEKLAEYQRELAKRRRGKVVWWVVGSVAAIAVVAVVVASFVFAPQRVTYEANNSTGRQIEGVQTFQNETQHTDQPVTYPQTPPAGGPHNPYWLNCGIYTEPQQNENAVHSMEHGAVWVTYDPERISGADLDTLKGWLPSSYTILSPYPGLDTPIAVSAWNAQLKVDDASDARIGEFFTEYWRSQNAPEPGAACSGGVEGPGAA